VTELLRGVPTYSRGISAELVTPTGAAILSALSEGYGDMPLMRTDSIGYGAGVLRLDFPNVLRVVIGEEQHVGGAAGPQASFADLLLQGDVVIQATFARLSPGEVETLTRRLADAGATDAWLDPGAPDTGPDAARTVLSVTAPGRLHPELVAILRSRQPVRILITPVLVAPTNE
jgi:uncharacterized protein (DUF111 family)